MKFLTDRLVTETMEYLNQETKVRNIEIVKYILREFPNSKIVSYRSK